MKKDYTSDFAEIKAMTNKIRNINESISFKDDFEDMMPEEMPEETQDFPYNEEKEIEVETNDPSSAVNKIREICLKGMIALCHTPEDPQYTVLKKVFAMVDKANDKKDTQEV